MEAKDGRMGFDFEGTYTKVAPHEVIEYGLADDRVVSVTFESVNGGVRVVESFEAEDANSAEMQRRGWQRRRSWRPSGRQGGGSRVNIARFLGATVAALIVLLLLNMFVFPLIFPTGVTSRFANMRPTPLVALHLAAFLITAVLLTALCAVPRRVGSSLAAAGIGATANAAFWRHRH
jgi:hypothetical protein